MPLAAGQINMLLSSLVLGPRHITSVANSIYLDPSPEVLRAWTQAAAACRACGGTGSNGGSSDTSTAATVVLPSPAFSKEFVMGKLK